MNQEEVLAKLKKDVRSLLISSKLGLDPEKLRRDYTAMLGRPMPLKELGFRNVLDMAKEMPDVVSVVSGADGTTYLKAVSDESTRNIQELVARQRVSSTDKRWRRGGHSSFSPRYGQPSPAPFLPRRGCAPPAVPARLRAQLRLLLSQAPLRLSDLEYSYLCCFGYPLLVHNYGFHSIGEMLGTAADMLMIVQSRLGSLVTLREHMLPRALVRPVLNKAVKTSIQGSHSNVETPATSPADVPKTWKPRDQPPTEEPVAAVHNAATTVSITQETVDGNQEDKSTGCQEGQLFQKQVLKLEEEFRLQMVDTGVAGTISQELKDKLRKVVGQMPGGLSVHDLPTEYKRLFGEDLPLKQSGFVSVSELVGAMSDSFNLKLKEGDNVHHLIVLDNTQTEGIDTSMDDEEEPVMSYYFNSGNSAWEHPLETNHDVEAENTSEGLDNTYFSKTYALTTEICGDIQVHSTSTVPPDAMQSQRLRPPTRRGVRALAGVLVEYVESPEHFYIRFNDSEEVRALEDMMIEMRRCYTCPKVAERYRLPEQFVRRGQVCCVSPGGMWFYRVVIHRLVSPAEVEVYYVDFGDVKVVERASLMYLKSSYSVLPAQAVPSSLAGITAPTGGWTVEAVASFQVLCSDRSLVGALDRYSGEVLELYLCDTNTDDDVYIHTVLLSQGHGTAAQPSAAAALGHQVTPVRLYLGEGMVDLPEVELKISSPKPAEKTALATPELCTQVTPVSPILVKGTEPEVQQRISSPQPADMIELATTEDKVDECHGVDFKENEDVSHTQAADIKPADGVLNDLSSSCSDRSSAVTCASPPAPPPAETRSPPTASDTIQSQPTSDPLHVDAKALCTTPPTTPTSVISPADRPTQEKAPDQFKVSVVSLFRHSPLLKSLNIPSSYLGPIQDSQGGRGAPINLRSSGVMFPLFGSSESRSR